MTSNNNNNLVCKNSRPKRSLGPLKLEHQESVGIFRWKLEGLVLRRDNCRARLQIIAVVEKRISWRRVRRGDGRSIREHGGETGVPSRQDESSSASLGQLQVSCAVVDGAMNTAQLLLSLPLRQHERNHVTNYTRKRRLYSSNNSI